MNSRKKIANLRFFLILFICICTGSLVASLTFDKPFFEYYVIGAIAVLLILVVVIMKKRSILPVVCIVGLLFTYATGMSVIKGSISSPDTLKGDMVKVRVEYVSDDLTYVRVIDGIDGVDGLCSFDSRAMFDNRLDIGNEIILDGVTLNKQPVMRDGALNTFFFNSRTRYELVAQDLVMVSEGNKSITEIMRSGLISACDNLPEDIRGVTIALLTGDKYAVDDSVYRNYRVSGVAHVLAVSGMHVGFLVIFIEWVFKKFRFKRLTRILTLIPITFFLCALCDFTPSVVRASIMIIVHLLIPVLTKRRYDMLSSISLSGCIIVLINPMSIHSYSFLLSFASVTGIALFSKSIEKRLAFLPKFLSSTLAVSLATTISVFPLTVYLFGEFSILSLLTNVIVLPVLSVGYGILVAFSAIAVIFPPFAFLIQAGGSVVYFLNFVTGVIASVDIASVTLSAPLWFCLTYYVCVTSVSGYVNFSTFTKRMILIALMILLIAYFCFLCKIA